MFDLDIARQRIEKTKEFKIVLPAASRLMRASDVVFSWLLVRQTLCVALHKREVLASHGLGEASTFPLGAGPADL